MDGQHDREERAWTCCSPGTIQELVQRLQAADSRRTALRRGRLLTIAALLVTGVWVSREFLGYRDQQPVLLTCAEVRANLEAFRAGALPASIREKMAAHLDTCPSCQALWQSLDLHAWRCWLPSPQCGDRQRDFPRNEISHRPVPLVIDRESVMRNQRRGRPSSSRPNSGETREVTMLAPSAAVSGAVRLSAFG